MTTEDMTQEIALLEPLDDLTVVFTAEGELEKTLSLVETRARAFVPDLSTGVSRKAIAAMAHKVSRSKTALDQAGKDLTEEWRAKTKIVNAARNTITERLDALRDEVRKPLTDWEEAEETRVSRHKHGIDQIVGAPTSMAPGASAADIRVVIDIFEARDVSGAAFEEYAPMAAKAREEALDTLKAMLREREKYEAEQAELAQLRAAKARQEEKDRKAAEKKAADDAAKKAEEVRVQREALAKARMAEIEKQAREKADREAAERVKAAERAAEQAKADAAAQVEKAAAEAKAAKEREDREAALADAKEKAAAEKRQANARLRGAAIKKMTVAIKALLDAEDPKDNALRADLIATAIMDRRIEPATVAL